MRRQNGKFQDKFLLEHKSNVIGKTVKKKLEKYDDSEKHKLVKKVFKKKADREEKFDQD